MHEIPYSLIGLYATVILGFLSVIGFMRSQFQAISERFDAAYLRQGRIETRLIIIEGDLRQFYSVTGKPEGLASQEARAHD
jgi:hypothetical protein